MLSVRVSADSSEIILPSCYLYSGFIRFDYPGALWWQDQNNWRSSSGHPADEQLAKIEEELADDLRNSVTELLRANQRVLDEMSHDLDFILDNKLNNNFESITDRIENVADVNGYVRYLEVMCVAYLLGKQFKKNLYPEWRKWLLYAIYKLYKLYATVGNAVHLLYRMDTNQQRGHYDLLIPTCQPGASSLPPTAAHSTVSSISFDQFLHNTFPLAPDTSTPTLPKTIILRVLPRRPLPVQAKK